MCAIEDFHGLIPLVILQKHLLKTYLGEEVCKDDEQLAFLWHMINCRSYEIVPIVGNEEFKIGTRFDEEDHYFYAFGF